jgi:predicted Zn-ribbon and HTH transcriptional regulator
MTTKQAVATGLNNKKEQEIKKEDKKEDVEVKKAIEVLQQEEQRKINAFMEDYKKVCVKHGMELSVEPQLKWVIKKI